jgi:hypothetical protein
MDWESVRPVERVLTRTFVTSNGCWEYLGNRWDGYGRVMVGSRLDGTRKKVLAHRVVWEHFRGPIPAGLVIDHLCRNRACQRPDHMRTVTWLENTFADGSVALPKSNADKTHCKRGHSLAGSNLYTHQGTGKRYCRACRRERQKKWNASYPRREK